MKNLKNSFIAVLIILSSAIYKSYGQTPVNEPNFWDNVRFGGNLGGSFGNRFTSIIIAPQAIYQFNPKIGLGAGLNYSYIKRNFNDGFTEDFSSRILGGSFITVYNPLEYLQLSTDLEYLNVKRDFENSFIPNDNYWVPALFIGAGYRQGGVIIGARYDVLFDANRSVYQNGIQPFVRLQF